MDDGQQSRKSTESDGLLDSWKEIAAHLGISVRAAQMWEEDLGLPVHRKAGVRGRVWAVTSEIDQWRARIGEPARQEERIAARRRRLGWALLAVCLLAAVISTLYFLHLPPWLGRPASWRVEGLMLVVRGEDGRDLWRYRLPSLPGPARAGGPRFADIDGDGRDELLFPLMEVQDSQISDQLLCFSSTGTLKWSWRPDKQTRTKTQTFDGHYRFTAVLSVRLPGASASHVLTVATHQVDAPSVVTLLDAQGRTVREYWHFGHFGQAVLADVDGDGRPELLLPDISNGYRTATLVVLDPFAMDGASLEQEPSSQLLDLAAPRERARLIFGRTSLNRVAEPYNAALAVDFAPNRLVVMVRERGGFEQPAAILYTFGQGLAIESAHSSDILRATYRRQHAQGLLPVADPELEIPDLLKEIRFLTPWH